MMFSCETDHYDVQSTVLKRATILYNQLTVMGMTRGERKVPESKLNGQTDSHSD